MSWEWRRVRRGFGRSSRQKLIDELQFWNDALKACLDKTELPLDYDNPTSALEAVRSKFDPADCNNIRQHALQIHSALAGAWRCQSHHHQGNLKLSWHTGTRAMNAKKLSLIFPSLQGETATSTSWHVVACDIIEPSSAVSPAPAPLPIPEQPPASTPSLSRRPRAPSPPRPWKRMKGWLQSSPVPARGEEETPLAAMSAPPPGFTSITCSADPYREESPPEVHCLCSFLGSSIKSGRLAIRGESYHTGYDSGSQACLGVERLGILPILGSLPLDAILSRPFADRALSRKDRFGIAAAATWAVLYLAGSPWIGPDWAGKDSLTLFTEGQALQSFQIYPALSYVFRHAQLPPTTAGPGRSPYAQVGEIRAGIIRNRTLFALGILLIELCLDIRFEDLRREFGANPGSLPPSTGTGTGTGTGMPLDDYEVANACMQRVYLEGGDLYGYAVQRCLRCEFPGRDVTKSFEFEQFRSDFFQGVVAPVQVTYDWLQALHDGLQIRT